jgi:hypothetical protein
VNGEFLVSIKKVLVMKKLLFTLMSFLVFCIPMMAQTQEDLTMDEVPVESLTLKQGNIPSPIINAAETLFSGSTQVAWGSFPYELKDYGWAVNKDYDEPIDHYEVKMLAVDGSEIYAVFESTGELISCKVINKNATTPKFILDEIKKGDYRDWNIVGDVMLIKNTQKKVVEHYAVKIQKGNDSRTLYFTTRGENLALK